MPQKFKVIIDTDAKIMLGEHVRFLANVDEDASRKTEQRILKAIYSLESMPARYPFFTEDYFPSKKYHKLVVGERYIILYQIQDSNVYVDYVLDCRQDFQWLLGN